MDGWDIECLISCFLGRIYDGNEGYGTGFFNSRPCMLVRSVCAGGLAEVPPPHPAHTEINGRMFCEAEMYSFGGRDTMV